MNFKMLRTIDWAIFNCQLSNLLNIFFDFNKIIEE